ncbi:site-specific recombinase [Streptococcus equi subsp. zooepidemicus ATCC 35246]|nr:site-specific recombinase [Streptococcus equi subsp. zooepidemicus ATCC 35246]
MNRLTLVTLLDRINISENQEISLVFHDLNEIAILQELSFSEVGVI